MSKESRICYHAVPRILKAPLEPWNIQNEDIQQDAQPNAYENCINDLYWKPFNDYVQNSRININIRQVLKNGQNKLIR